MQKTYMFEAAIHAAGFCADCVRVICILQDVSFIATTSVSQLSDFQAVVQTLAKYNYVAARKRAEFKNSQQPYA